MFPLSKVEVPLGPNIDPRVNISNLAMEAPSSPLGNAASTGTDGPGPIQLKPAATHLEQALSERAGHRKRFFHKFHLDDSEQDAHSKESRTATSLAHAQRLERLLALCNGQGSPKDSGEGGRTFASSGSPTSASGPGNGSFPTPPDLSPTSRSASGLPTPSVGAGEARSPRSDASPTSPITLIRTFDVALRHSIMFPRKHLNRLPPPIKVLESPMAHSLTPLNSPSPSMAANGMNASTNVGIVDPFASNRTKKLLRKSSMHWLSDPQRLECASLKETMESYDEHCFYFNTAMQELRTERQKAIRTRQLKLEAEFNQIDPRKCYPLKGVGTVFYYPSPADELAISPLMNEEARLRLIESRVRQAASTFTFSPLVLDALCGRHRVGLLYGSWQKFPSPFHFRVKISAKQLRTNLRGASFGALSHRDVDVIMNYIKSQITPQEDEADWGGPRGGLRPGATEADPYEEQLSREAIGALNSADYTSMLAREENMILPTDRVAHCLKAIFMANLAALKPLYDSFTRLPSPMDEELSEDLRRANPVHDHSIRVLADSIALSGNDPARVEALTVFASQFHPALAQCVGLSTSRARKVIPLNSAASSADLKRSQSLAKTASSKQLNNASGEEVDLAAKAGIIDRGLIGSLPAELLQIAEDEMNPPWPPTMAGAGAAEGAGQDARKLSLKPKGSGKLLKNSVQIPTGGGLPDPSYFEAFAVLLGNSPSFACFLAGFFLRFSTVFPQPPPLPPTVEDVFPEEEEELFRKRRLQIKSLLPANYDAPEAAQKQ